MVLMQAQVNSDLSVVHGFSCGSLEKSKRSGSAAVKDSILPSVGGGRGAEESSRHLLVDDGVGALVSPRQCSCSVWKRTGPAELSLSAVSWHSPGSVGRLGEEQ